MILIKHYFITDLIPLAKEKENDGVKVVNAIFQVHQKK